MSKSIPSVQEFYEKNRILEEDWKYVRFDSPDEHFIRCFSRPDKSGTLINYMQATGQQYWGDHHYNAVAYGIYTAYRRSRKDGQLHERDETDKFIVTRDCSECDSFLQGDYKKVISSPILYAGHSRRQEWARSIWGICIDLDCVTPTNLRTMRLWIDHLEWMPEPSMVISSGGGLHIYYLFPIGLGTRDSTVATLQRLKHNMTKYLWNDLLSSDPVADNRQGIWQGFSLPGTPTKMEGVNVVGFSPIDIPYYTVRELNNWFQVHAVDSESEPLTEEEIAAADDNRYLPSPISFKEAQERWPEWDPTTPPGQWTVNRRLYDWWLNKVILGGQALRENIRGIVPLAAGRRYYWLLSLVAFAKKCGVPYEEVRKDALALVPMLDSLSISEENRFTESDAKQALKAYFLEGKQSLARYTKKYIGAKTHFYFKENKRNGRSQAEHIEIMNAIRGVMAKNGTLRHRGSKRQQANVGMWSAEHPYCSSHSECARELGLDPHAVARWWPKKAPNTVQEAILKWRQDNPDCTNKAKCAKECHVSRTTVTKWWNCTAGDVAAAAERQASRLGNMMAAAGGRKAGEKTVGAAPNTGYAADGKVAEMAMRNTPGYRNQDNETVRKTQERLTEEINWGTIDMESVMKAMGVPDFMIPMLKDEFRRKMATQGFWDEYRKARGSVDMSAWPPEVRMMFEEATRKEEKG